MRLVEVPDGNSATGETTKQPTMVSGRLPFRLFDGMVSVERRRLV